MTEFQHPELKEVKGNSLLQKSTLQKEVAHLRQTTGRKMEESLAEGGK